MYGEDAACRSKERYHTMYKGAERKTADSFRSNEINSFEVGKVHAKIHLGLKVIDKMGDEQH